MSEQAARAFLKERAVSSLQARKMPADLRCVRRWPSAKTRKWTQEFVDALCADERVDAVVAVGSAVRGVGHERSDLDLILVYHGEQPKLGTPR